MDVWSSLLLSVSLLCLIPLLLVFQSESEFVSLVGVQVELRRQGHLQGVRQIVRRCHRHLQKEKLAIRQRPEKSNFEHVCSYDLSNLKKTNHKKL